MKIQFKSKRKPTGGLYHKLRKKKLCYMGRDFYPVKIDETKAKKIRKMGGNTKCKLLQANIANVLDSSTNKIVKSKIITVKQNPANIHFVRMNILTKGAVIQTEAGLARITSRPGQDGVINAILVKA